MSCRSIIVIAVCITAFAQTTPSGWKVVKEENSVCQVSTPSEWKALGVESLLQDPKQVFMLTLAHEEYDSFAPLSADVLKAHNPAKVVENSNKRIFLIGQATATLNVTSKTWDLWVPASKGSCHISLNLRSNADEELARRIADTLKALK